MIYTTGYLHSTLIKDERMIHSTIAPGMRIELRNEEWLVRRVDATQSGGQQLTCIGLSELVRDKEALFLTELMS